MYVSGVVKLVEERDGIYHQIITTPLQRMWINRGDTITLTIDKDAIHVVPDYDTLGNGGSTLQHFDLPGRGQLALSLSGAKEWPHVDQPRNEDRVGFHLITARHQSEEEVVKVADQYPENEEEALDLSAETGERDG